MNKEFQSTLPARGATDSGGPLGELGQDFNPRSPHGERPAPVLSVVCPSVISIHAPRTGSDAIQSTPNPSWEISIHAPRTGSDVNRRHSVTAYK